MKSSNLEHATKLSAINTSCYLKLQRVKASLYNCQITPIIYQVSTAFDEFFLKWEIEASSTLNSPFAIEKDK